MAAAPELTPEVQAAIAVAREHYARELADGVDRFFEPRRGTCPWCGDSRLRVLVRARDLIQHKPGRFTLERCATCGHVFQNPRLSQAGLDFYYRDFYDGAGAETSEAMFDAAREGNLARARDLAHVHPPGSAAPGTWLDVGTGYGHFCRDARTVWPRTTFDGLDMGASVLEGQSRGWLDHAHRGMLPELSRSLAGRYDVVSMHHYLEHAREPRIELDAAIETLAPGGHLVVEVPNPDSALAHLLGRWWPPWFQPQHQHFVPVGNLLQALAHRGFSPVLVVRGAAHLPLDLSLAAMLPMGIWGPYPHLPWGPAHPTPGQLRRYAAVGKLAPKVFRIVQPLDKARGRVAVLTDRGNAYRVVARRDRHRR